MERLPANLEIGMKVFDSQGHHIGKVDGLKYPETIPGTDQETADTSDVVDERDDTIIDAVADVFAGDDQLPEALRSRLLHDGYLHLDGAGLFAHDRYVLPEQVAGVTAEGITLNVTKDALIKH